jgi:hypothetical protein
MSSTDRIRAYYNLHKKCFSVQDYRTGKVVEHTNKLYLSNALFVVRKSGNERVKKEGRKNVHAFVNGIRHNNSEDVPLGSSYQVSYNPHTMDYFHYCRHVVGYPQWLPVDRHWIGNVWLYMFDGKPVIYADIDKLSGEILSVDALDVEPNMTIKGKTFEKLVYPNGNVSIKFLERKRKIIKNKKGVAI